MPLPVLEAEDAGRRALTGIVVDEHDLATARGR